MWYTGPPMRQAFTLIELLVVVAIIAILASMTLMMISSVREQAKRTQCANNLRNWGAAHHGWANDHEGQVMSTARLGDWDPCPNVMFSQREAAPRDTCNNVPEIVQYLPGGEQLDNVAYGTSNTKLVGVWSCPTSPGTRLPGWGGGGLTPFHWAYSYFGQVESWKDHRGTDFASNRSSDLTDKFPDANRLMMADAIYIWEGNYQPDAWYINHTRTAGRLDAMTGINRLFGDGRVEWKSRGQFDLTKMWDRDASVPRVKSDDLLTYY
jgi:prepilin-type N-terminal cleavage/methylation domain-containing protein